MFVKYFSHVILGLVALVARRKAPMKERHLKVYEASGNKHNVPRINLQGDWLSALGYKIGDHVKVSFSENRIIIEPEIIDPSPSQISG